MSRNKLIIKKSSDELFPGDLIEIESKLYKAVPLLNPRERSCQGCAFNLNGSCQALEIKCFEGSVILIEQSTVFKPKLLVVGESIEILGLNLKIVKGLNCKGCVFNYTFQTNSLCRRVDCFTNGVIISNEVDE